MSYSGPQIGGDFRQCLDRFAFHAERTRRINSSWEIGLLAPDLKSASRFFKTRLCEAGTGMVASSATDNHSRSAISSRSRLGK